MLPTALLLLALPGQVAVTVDPTPGAPISPLIYGMNFPANAHISQGGVTVARWGGNSTTRYNYKTDVHNTGADYFFENLPGCWGEEGNYCATPPSDPQESSTANAFLANAQAANITALFTIPTMGFVPAPPAAYAHPFPCSCQSGDAADPYDTACHDGMSGGASVDCSTHAQAIHLATSTEWTSQWVAYLVARFGPSNGKRIYALDNEPALWSSTHRDIRTSRLGYDELWQRMRDHADAILDADPTALIAGPAEWGWPNYFCSDADNVAQGCSPTSPDRAAHGGQELVAWLLEQAKAHELAHGRRILHFLDLHYYPQGGSNPGRTRSLWDPSYVDPSWINDTIQLLPRMRAWVDQHYPGTRLALSEYDFYDHDNGLGAVTYAEVLGLFGKHGLDMATAWSPPAPTERAFAAFKLFRNFDGNGGAFEANVAQATVTGSGVKAFAASNGQRVTVALINEASVQTTVDVNVGSFPSNATAAVFGSGNGSDILARPAVAVVGGHASVTLGGTSLAMVVFTSSVAPASSSSSGSTSVMAGSSGTSTSGTGGSMAASSAGVASSAAGSTSQGAPASSVAGASSASQASSPSADGGGGAAPGCACSTSGDKEFPLWVLGLVWVARRRQTRLS